MLVSFRALAPCFLAACVSLAGGAAPPGLDALGDSVPDGVFLRLGTLRFRHPDKVQSLALSPDGGVVAAADAEMRVRLWDTKAGRLLLTLPPVCGGNVAFSPDGLTLATAGGGRYGKQPVGLWDARTGKSLRTFPALTERAVAFSADGSMIAGGQADGQVAVCESGTGRLVHRLPGPPGNLSALAFSADGKSLAAGDEIGWGTITCLVLDLATGKERCRAEDKTGGTTRGLAFSPDGKTLAVATPYKTWIRDARTGAKVAVLGPESANAVAFDPAGRLATAGDDIRLLAPETYKVVRAMPRRGNPAHGLAMSADGKLVVTTAPLDHRIRLWDTDSGEERFVGNGHRDEVRAVAWSPDGRTVATGSGGDGSLRLWDALTGVPGRIFRFEDKPGQFARSRDLSDMAFTPDGKALRGADRRWDAITGASSALESGWVATARSRDGKLVAHLGDLGGGDIVLIKDEAGRVLHRIPPLAKGRSGRRPMAFSPDGRLLALADIAPGSETTLRPSVHLWDTRTGQLVRRMRPALGQPENLMFSPDGSVLATSQWAGTPELFDVASGRRVFELTGHEVGARHWDGVRPLAFAPDGAVLATGGGPGVIVLWETASGQEIRTLRGHEGWVRALAFSPDGTRLLSGGSDTTALVWAVAPHLSPPAEGTETAARLWSDLSKHPHEAYPAMWALSAWGDRAVRLLKARLRPDPPLDVSRIGRLIADLTAEEFEAREEATKALQVLGFKAEPALRRVLASTTDLEQRRRVERLLAQLEQAASSEQLRDRRAIQVLEGLNRPAAEALLRELAGGDEAGRKTVAARAALERMKSLSAATSAGRAAR